MYHGGYVETGFEANAAWGYASMDSYGVSAARAVTARQPQLHMPTTAASCATPQRQRRPLNPLAKDWLPSGCASAWTSQALERMEERLPIMLSGRERCATGLSAEALVGCWMDSLGNLVDVYMTDAYDTRVIARLSNPPRRDIMLSLRPLPGGGWVCGNSMLDPEWTTMTQLHWLTVDGRVSVWARLRDDCGS
mmetsp:Transcript_72746/g.162857  ORF Transcript_72746/g.162857 Transcript_72746/m.162857 type:complete len:193 (-) Transcript_72746:20-598(-)